MENHAEGANQHPHLQRSARVDYMRHSAAYRPPLGQAAQRPLWATPALHLLERLFPKSGLGLSPV